MKMPTQETLMRFYLFGFFYLIKNIYGGYNTGISQITTPMNWYEGYHRCYFANEQDLRSYDAYYTAWAGGLYLNTPWMEYHGCFLNKASMQAGAVYSIKYNSPASCSFKCKTSRYFALKPNWCVCLLSLRNMEEMYLDNCIHKCVGDRNYFCGGSNSYTIYNHVSDENLPEYHLNQNLRCTAVRVHNNKIVLTATDCLEKHHVLCMSNSGGIELEDTLDTYNNAAAKCNLLRFSSTNVSIGSRLKQGQMYWTSIHRHLVLQWINRYNMTDLCYKNNLGALKNLSCLLTTRDYDKQLKFNPAPCNRKHHVVCSYKEAILKDESIEDIHNLCNNEGNANTEITTYHQKQKSTYTTSKELHVTPNAPTTDEVVKILSTNKFPFDRTSQIFSKRRTSESLTIYEKTELTNDIVNISFTTQSPQNSEINLMLTGLIGVFAWLPSLIS